MDNFNNLSNGSSGSDSSSESFIEDGDTKEVKEAKANSPEPTEFEYSERDVLLYNLGVGAKADELKWVYENSDEFQVSP
jgi:multifunctional beta-oxidation protein